MLVSCKEEVERVEVGCRAWVGKSHTCTPATTNLSTPNPDSILTRDKLPTQGSNLCSMEPAPNPLMGWREGGSRGVVNGTGAGQGVPEIKQR